jgi:hypothetical protein
VNARRHPRTNRVTSHDCILREPLLDNQQRWALPQDPDFKHLAGLQGLQCDESIWNMRSDVIQIVRSWADDQDSMFRPIMFC